MKIAIVSMYLPSGSKIGVGYQVHHLANALVRRGHHVTVFSQTGTSNDSEYEVVEVPSGKRLRTFGFAWNLRACDFSKFDVVNAHGDDWFLWGTQRPRLLHTFHGSCLAEMIHSRSITARLRMGLLALCEYNSCLLADELITVSQNTRRFIPFVKKVIPNGVDLQTFHPGPKSENPSILFVGTMHGRKRGAFLLDLFHEQIKPRVPNAEFWAVCENRVEGDGVHWFGRVPFEQLTELYRSAWAFCLPSTYEGFGIPYCEAMASGTAVVASPNLGAREVTQEGQCAIVCEDHKMAASLVGVLESSELRIRLENAGLHRAKDFGFDSVCAQYEALYQVT